MTFFPVCEILQNQVEVAQLDLVNFTKRVEPAQLDIFWEKSS